MGEFTKPSPEAIAAVTLALQQAFGNRCVTSEAVRRQHAHTLTWIENQPPAAESNGGPDDARLPG